MNSKRTGVTLIELMVTIAIMGIMITFGYSGYRSMAVRNQLSTHANIFLASLHRTRAEAVERQQRVTMCIPKSATQLTECDKAGADDWTAGWVIFVDDPIRDGIADNADELIYVHAPLAGKTTLKANQANFKNVISFTQSGVTRGIDGEVGAIKSGEIILCDADDEITEHRVIHIRRSGSPSVERLEESCSL